MNRTVVEFKRLGITACRRGNTLGACVRHMADSDISGMVVVDEEGYLCGIITRSDVLQARATSPAWQAEPIEKYMTQDVVTVSPETTLGEVVQILLEQRIHRVVVVREEADGRKRPISVVSDSDLICEMADQL